MAAGAQCATMASATPQQMLLASNLDSAWQRDGLTLEHRSEENHACMADGFRVAERWEQRGVRTGVQGS